MIAGLPQGPMGMVTIVTVVVVACALVMSALPVIDWLGRRQARLERERAIEREVSYKLEAMNQENKLFNDTEGSEHAN